MSTIWEITASALAPLGENLAADKYAGEPPDRFLVYSLVSSPPVGHGDNRELLREYRVQVSLYDRAGVVDYQGIVDAMTAAGFSAGPMRGIPFNQTTGHFGLVMEFVYLADTDD